MEKQGLIQGVSKVEKEVLVQGVEKEGLVLGVG